MGLDILIPPLKKTLNTLEYDYSLICKMFCDTWQDLADKEVLKSLEPYLIPPPKPAILDSPFRFYITDHRMRILMILAYLNDDQRGDINWQSHDLFKRWEEYPFPDFPLDLQNKQGGVYSREWFKFKEKYDFVPVEELCFATITEIYEYEVKYQHPLSPWLLTHYAINWRHKNIVDWNKLYKANFGRKP